MKNRKTATDGHVPESQSTAADMEDVLKAEWNQLDKRRRVAFRNSGNGLEDPADSEDQQADRPKAPSGLAFSGGGLRSASFCMGVTQALHKTGLWRFFDYLSTVSGGGYIGSYISSAVIKNKRRIAKEGGKFPLPADDIGSKDGSPGQPQEVKQFIYGGRYLMRGWQLANKYLIGVILSNLTLFSALIAACALIAFLWRCFDLPGFRERVRPIAYATEMDFLPSDIMAAFYPFVIFAIAWLIAWALSYLRHGSEATGRVARVLLFWVVASLLIGIALVLSSGDAQGFIEGFDPSALGAKFWGPIIAVVGGSLIPFLRPSRLMQSGTNPKNQFEKFTFTIATTGLLVGLPLLLIGFLGREDISGYYTSKDRNVVPGDISGKAWPSIYQTVLSPEFVNLEIESQSDSNELAEQWSLEKRLRAISSQDGIRPHLPKELRKEARNIETQIYEKTLEDFSDPIVAALEPYVSESGNKELKELAEQLKEAIGNDEIEEGSGLADLEKIDKDDLRKLLVSDPKGRPTGDSEKSRLMMKHYLSWLCVHLKYQERKHAEATLELKGEQEWSRLIQRDRLKRSADSLEWLAGFRRSLKNPSAKLWFWGNQKTLTRKIFCNSLNEFLEEPLEGADAFPELAGSFSVDDIRDGAKLAEVLANSAEESVDGKESFFKFVWTSFPLNVRKTLEDFRSANENQDPGEEETAAPFGDKEKIALVTGLNTIIRHGPIYTEDRFEGITLRPSAKGLLAGNPAGDDLAGKPAAEPPADTRAATPPPPLAGDRLVHLNRLLVEDAFESGSAAGAIRKTSPTFAFEGYFRRDDKSKLEAGQAVPPPLRSIVIYEDQAARLKIFFMALGVFALGLFVDLNFSSMHGYYRRRIASAFVVPEGEKRESPMLSALTTTDYGYPYHLISATVHQPRAKLSDEIREATSAAVREDNAEQPPVAPFLFSQQYCGSEMTGYIGTERYEELPVGEIANIDLADAAAISGAAMSPGRVQNLLLAFLMFVLNLRLGQWLPNPSKGRPPGRPRLGLFLRNAFRDAKDRDYLFVSDGGHCENLGLIPLLQRRCRLIVAIDAGCDPNHDFPDLARAIRVARIEEGIEIKPLHVKNLPRTEDVVADLEFSRRRMKGLPTPKCAKHFSMAEIHYPEKDAESGLLIYIKPSLTGDEGIDLIQYSRKHTEFPHESTSDQEFEWDKVESYRQLGFHIGSTLANLLPPMRKDHAGLWGDSASPADSVEQICQWFKDSWQKGSEESETSLATVDSVKQAVVDRVARESPGRSQPRDPQASQPEAEPGRETKPKKASKSKKEKRSRGKSKA